MAVTGLSQAQILNSYTMAKLSPKNVKQDSPAWLVNVTAVSIFLASYGPDIIDKMPGGISDLTKDWLHWVLGTIATVLGVSAAFAKGSRIIGGRPNDR